MKLDCVLFDHDDTLLPTFALRARALHKAAREILNRELDAESFLGASQGRNLEQMSGELTAGDMALAAKLVAAYRQRYYEANREGLTPYNGIAELLGTLRKRGIRIGVVTSKLATGARDELLRSGLSVHIEHLTGAEDVVAHKPAAEPLLRATTALQVDPARTLMIGDTSADILGARAAGTFSGAALWGAREPDSLRTLNPDHLLQQPAEILQLI